MSNLKQKVVSNNPEKLANQIKQQVKYNPENDNLGLDADGSSDYTDGRTNLNNDNDRISHNPDGEDDDHDTTEGAGNSPLMDK